MLSHYTVWRQNPYTLETEKLRSKTEWQKIHLTSENQKIYPIKIIKEKTK
jgi:hypothetical protein